MAKLNLDEILPAIAAAVDEGRSVSWTAKRLGISEPYTQRLAQNMGKPFRCARFWSDAELDELRTLAKTKTAKETAEILNRPVTQVKSQAAYRRIRFVPASRSR